MNAYDIAKDLDREGKFPGHVCYGTSPLLVRAANMLRQQADLIRNLQKSLGFKNSGYETINLTPQTKPLSDEEMKELINNFPIIFSPQDLLSFARAIEERHGIK